MAYDLEGSLLEFCDCNAICPCWIGEDPDKAPALWRRLGILTKGP